MSKITKAGKEAVVLCYLQTVEKATIETIYDNVHFGYDAYRKQHIDDTIDELVRRRAIIKIKVGVYAIPKKTEEVKQGSMF